VAKVVYTIGSSLIVEITETLTDFVKAAFCLAICLVVVRGSYLEPELKFLPELLLEVRGELTVSFRDNRERVSMYSEYLVQKDLGGWLCINSLGDRKQVCIATEAIRNYKNDVVFLVT
jgi:hypothetical protein